MRIVEREGNSQVPAVVPSHRCAENGPQNTKSVVHTHTHTNTHSSPKSRKGPKKKAPGGPEAPEGPGVLGDPIPADPSLPLRRYALLTFYFF